MLNELFPYYNQELSYVRYLAAEFAKAYPKIASHLRLGPNTIEDPHTARLIESFAFLTAHIRHKLDDDFPELTNALLAILYPHYLAPVPAFSIVQFNCLPELTAGYLLPSNTLLETDPTYSEPCRFNTIYPVTLWPIKVSSASMSGLPFSAPPVPLTQKPAAIIRLKLTCMAKEMTFAELLPANLCFFLDAPAQYAHPLYELIVNNVLGIAVASSPIDKNAIFLDRTHIRSVGFEKHQGLLPYSSRALPGYRLLTEFFVFPEKFLFFELIGLDKESLKSIGNQVEIFFYLSQHRKELERNINAGVFKLGCTPVVNLFQQTAEPIKLDYTQTSYQVVPDARRTSTMEIYSIQKVVALNAGGQETNYAPIYGVQHSADVETQRYFWQAVRKTKATADNLTDNITEMYLSFIDLNFDPAIEQNSIVIAETLCTNNDLPSKLPFGKGEPRLQLSGKSAPLSAITCLIPFTQTVRPMQRKEGHWKLISHLSLNHLSLIEKNEGIEALKEIFRLYNFKNSMETNRLIESLLKVSSRRTTARSPAGFRDALCQGIEITLQFDETQFTGYSLFLFAQILEHFFASYASLNSFTKLIVTSLQKTGILYQWLPRAGEKMLL